MPRSVGVWIDHQKAVIAVPGGDSVTTVPSEVRGHTRFTRGGGYPAGNASLGGASERRQEERHQNDLSRYFDDVIKALGDVDEVLILGPGEAKQELHSRMAAASARPQPSITVETADKMTDAQIVARVSSHFRAG